MNEKEKEMYFVTSAADVPNALYFNREEALATNLEYVDSFDASGKKVSVYQLMNGEYVKNI